MANTFKLFMTPDDELALFRHLAQYALEIYPVRVPLDWVPFRADEDAYPKLPEDAMYLAASQIAPVLVDKVKRGKDKGSWRVDEVRSPVIFYERCRVNEEGELVAGKLWAELDVTPQTGRTDPAPERFRKLFLDLDGWLKTRFRKGDLKGFWVGPHAAREAKAGLVLRDSEHRGPTIKPFR
jgi:hypothetical protein